MYCTYTRHAACAYLTLHLVALWHCCQGARQHQTPCLAQGHVGLLQYLQAKCPQANPVLSNKGLTAEQMLAAQSTP